MWHLLLYKFLPPLTATYLRDTGEDIPNRERPDDEAGEITNESGRGKTRLASGAILCSKSTKKLQS